MGDTLLTLKRGDRFTVPALPHVPVLTFERLDGMYSRSETEDGQICWLAAWTSVVREGRDG